MSVEQNTQVNNIDYFNLDFASLKIKAEEPNAAAKLELIGRYFFGEKGTEKNALQAVKWCQKIIKEIFKRRKKIDLQEYRANKPIIKNTIGAILGHCYLHGEGLKQNDELAFKWLKNGFFPRDEELFFNGLIFKDLTSLYEKGDIKSQQFLENFFESDDSFLKPVFFDLTKSASFFPLDAYQKEFPESLIEKLAERGSIKAQYELSSSQDKDKAVYWLEKLAHQEPQFQKTDCHNNEESNLPIDIRVIEAQYRLGSHYFNSKDYKKGAKWYEKAVEWHEKSISRTTRFTKEYIDALYKLAGFYSEGKGADKYVNKAFELFKQSFLLENFVLPPDFFCLLDRMKNDTPYLYNFALCYYLGIGTEQNYSEAFKWFQVSEGYEMSKLSHAQVALGICYFHGHGVEQNLEKSEEFFNEASKQNNASGYLWLAYVSHIKTEAKKDKLFDSLSEEERIFLQKFGPTSQGLPPSPYTIVRMTDEERKKDELQSRLENIIREDTTIENLCMAASIFFKKEDDFYHFFGVSDFIFPTEVVELLGKNKDSVSKVILAYYYECRNKKERSIEYLKIAASQEDILACKELGKYYERHEEFDQAIAYYEKAKNNNTLHQKYIPDIIKEVTEYSAIKIEIVEYKKIIKEKNQQLKLEIHEKEKAYKIAHEKEKEMLSFFTHTMRNALATAPESLRQAIRLLGSDDYETNQKHYEAINEITSLFSTISLVDCLIDTFKQSIYDTDEFKRAWQEDKTGNATPYWFIAAALRQSLNRIIFMEDATRLRTLLGNQDELIDSTRKTFIEQVLPLDVNQRQQDVTAFYQWLESISAIETTIEPCAAQFGAQQVKFSLLFAISSELILNALKYWSGTGKIQVDWFKEAENYVFSVKNPCKANAKSRLAGTHKGLAFIKRLIELLGESAQFNCTVENEVFCAELKLNQTLLENQI